MSAHEEVPAARLPVWTMGLANMPTGFVYGFISTAMGILLLQRGVSVETIGRTSFIAFSPTFWAWLLSPVLDVRFTKRFYGFLFAALAALLLAATVLSLGDIHRFTVLLTASCTCASLYSSCVGGWAPDALESDQYNEMSGWFNVANLGAAGVFSLAAVELVRHLSLHVTAALLAALVFLPALLVLRFPAPPEPDGSLAQNFRSMGRDLQQVLLGTRVWLGLVLFLSPICFSLTNLFSSLGGDFHVSETSVATLNGPLVAVACSAGCLLAIPLASLWTRRGVFLASGVGAAACAMTMALCPHSFWPYALGLLGYNLCQGFNYTAFMALVFEIVGPKNALAGAMTAMLVASANIPISTMTWLDGHAHDRWGLNAMFWVDAGSALVAVVTLAWALPRMDQWVVRREA